MGEHVMRKGGAILYILMLRDQSSHVWCFYFVWFHENGKSAAETTLSRFHWDPLISRPTCRSITNVSSSPLSSFCNRHGSYPGPGVSQPSTMATTVPYSQPTGNNGSDMGNGQAPAYSLAPSGTLTEPEPTESSSMRLVSIERRARTLRCALKKTICLKKLSIFPFTYRLIQPSDRYTKAQSEDMTPVLPTSRCKACQIHADKIEKSRPLKKTSPSKVTRRTTRDSLMCLH